MLFEIFVILNLTVRASVPQYPTASPAIQPGVSSFDSNAEQRLQMALVHFMHEYLVASKQE